MSNLTEGTEFEDEIYEIVDDFVPPVDSEALNGGHLVSPPLSAALSSAGGYLQSVDGSSMFRSPATFGSTPSGPLTPEPRIYPRGGGSVTKSEVSPSTPSVISGNGERGGSGCGTYLGHTAFEGLRGGPWAEERSRAPQREVGPTRGTSNLYATTGLNLEQRYSTQTCSGLRRLKREGLF